MTGRALALGLATLLLTSAPALADDMEEPMNWARTGVYLEGGANLIVEDFHATTNRGTPKSEVNGALNLRAGWRPTSRMAFEIQYERISNLLQNNSVNLITVNAKIFFKKPGGLWIWLFPSWENNPPFGNRTRWQPFLRTGFGSIFGDLPGYWTRKSPLGTLSAQNGFVWKIGSGVDYGINDHLSASLFFDYVIPTQEFHKLNYAAMGVGLRYRF